MKDINEKETKSDVGVGVDYAKLSLRMVDVRCQNHNYYKSCSFVKEFNKRKRCCIPCGDQTPKQIQNQKMCRFDNKCCRTKCCDTGKFFW